MFKPNIVLNIELDNITDEDVGSEKFMEILGYYSINDVNLSKCNLTLKSTTNDMIGPVKTLRA